MEVTINKERKVAYAALDYAVGIGDFVVTVRKPNGDTINPTISEQGNGIYTFLYTPDSLGLWQERIVSAINGDNAFQSLKVVSYDEDDLQVLVDSVQTDVDVIESDVGDIKDKTDQLEFHAGVIATVDEFIGTALTQLEGRASQSSVDALGIDLGALTSDVADIKDIVTLLKAFITNKKYLQKIGPTWYLIIKNSLETDDILHKALKDKDGNNITDIAAGILTQEMGSSV